MSYNYLWTVFILVATGFARDLTRDCLNNPAPILNDFQTTILLLHNAARGKHEVCDHTFLLFNISIKCF